VKSTEEVLESLGLNVSQVDELALQYGGVRERERETEGLDAWYQTAVNLITVRNFVLRLSSLSE